MTDINLLMVHADDHRPVLDRVAGDSLKDIGPAGKLPGYLWDEGGDPNDLRAQRWGILAPAGRRGDRLLEIVAPLVAHRREQQGKAVRVYRVPANMSQAEAVQWKKTVFRPQTSLDIEVPRYQLILGDLHEVSLAVQQVQGSDGYVGRLAFDRDEDYAAYVDKLLRWERSPSHHREGRALFHTVHDATAATRNGHRALVTPGISLVQRGLERGEINADRIDESGDPDVPDPQELLTAARTDRPAFLFSLSHGLGPPRAGWRDAVQQRLAQGAMNFGHEGNLRGEDLRDAVFMPGGVWFMLACFGAGSPPASAYQHWLAELHALGQYHGDPAAVLAGIPQERPFVAAVPRAVLASSNGPLGFIGHIDLAWSYSFSEPDPRAASRPAKFMGILRSVLKRDRLGVGFRELHRYLDQTNDELTGIADDDKASGRAPDPARRARAAHLWMLRQDLAAYVLLGDPAARLPLTDPRAPPGPRPMPENFAAPEPVALPLAIDALEQAICKVLAGQGIQQIALEYGVERDELKRLAKLYRAAGRCALGVPEA